MYGCPDKTVHPFRNLLAVLPPSLHLYNVETREKILDADVQRCLWGLGGGGGEGLGKGELTKRLTSANVSQDFCP